MGFILQPPTLHEYKDNITCRYTMPVKYHVEKEVKFGPYYVEHVYPRKSENLYGLWIKCGHSVSPDNRASWDYLCDFCKEDWRTRTHLVNPFSNSVERSYQVRCVTSICDKWEWDRYVCENTAECWGPKKKLFEIRRSQAQWMLTWKTEVGKVPNTVNRVDKRLFCRTYRNSSPNVSRSFEDGISPWNYEKSNFFLHKNEYQGLKKYFYISLESRRHVPKDITERMIKDRPPFYQAPVYTCPNNMEIVTFITNKFFEDTLTWELLNKRCQPVEHTFISVYPGGAGMKVWTFIYVM